ncbi:uncharacterized protein LOC123704554 [Colias croceus]|uniref:uncharacterized protein LOC123704554 n=1 Tax=Colias crocea TaxID=72248 RepID=UPI001E2802CB|nr:uncharacterized protein LOC123704554 [Colias croceus]
MADEMPSYIEEMKDEMSPTVYTRFEDKSKVYKPKTLEELLGDTRRYWKTQRWGTHQYGTYGNRGQVCVYIQMSYKNAITNMKRYFRIRGTYADNSEYEIGYVTHEIIFHYQILLELYQLIEKRFLLHPKLNAAPTELMLYFYSNIVEESRTIIYLCNMLHEVEQKYKGRGSKKNKNAFDDYLDESSKKGSKSNVPLTKEEQYEEYVKMKEREAARKRRQLAKQRKQMEKYGVRTRPSIFVTKKGRFPLHYGWSIEEW